MITSREIRLKSRIVGAPVADNFELATVSVPTPALGEVQVKNFWMSVDPYMRGRMVDRSSYDPHPPLGRGNTSARNRTDCRGQFYYVRLAPAVPAGRSVARGRGRGSCCVRGPTVLSQAISSRPCLAGESGSTRLSAPWRSSIHWGSRLKRSWASPV